MRKKFLDEQYSALVKHVERYDFTGGQIVTFFKWCFENGFMDNLTMGDLIDFYSSTDRLCLPILRKNGITIGIDSYDEHFRFGIDPTKCFDKVSKASVIINFPITSKREERLIYKTLDTLLDKKSKRSRDWFRCAPHSWCGEYLNNAS